MNPFDVLCDPTFAVPTPPFAASGVAWLRASVVRFSEGSDHTRRRGIVERILSAVSADDLHRAGDHVAALANALGLTGAVAAEVRLVASCYQPHLGVIPGADAAVDRLVHACGGVWDEETANRIGLLVQACEATAAMVAGVVPPVATTTRIDPVGAEVRVDLSEHPFGAGRHACPGRRHAEALVAGMTLFRRLHDGPEPLMLPNAWDVVSAEMFVAAGYRAVGTTSLGVAAASGIIDGVGATEEAMMSLARALSALPVPVTVDVEAGWGRRLDELAAELAEAGIAGVNVEDSLDGALLDPEVHAEAIGALKSGAPTLFVNARIDTHWLRHDQDSTLHRARLYVGAGADGVFTPGLVDESELSRLVRAVDGTAVNVLAGPDPARLRDIGVRRISTGSTPYRAALSAARSAAHAALSGRAMPPDSLSYSETNGLAAAHVQRTRDRRRRSTSAAQRHNSSARPVERV